METYRYFHDRNLLRQYDLLKDCVALALKQGVHVPEARLLFDLNHTATVNLSEHAGRPRPHDVVIRRSSHKPPPWQDVPRHIGEFLQTLRQKWENESAIWLAAYCLWRINWIHPFAEGNGRTARAVCYFVLCVKYGVWLPGSKSIPHQIRNDREPYYKMLNLADAAWKEGRIDLTDGCAYLEQLLKVQLQSS